MSRRLKILLTILISIIFIYLALRLADSQKWITIGDLSRFGSDSAPTDTGDLIRATKTSIFSVYKKDVSTVIVVWENLPQGTAAMKIYRSDPKTGKVVLWKTINPGSYSAGGNIEIKLDKKEIAEEEKGGVIYYAEAISAGGGTTWTSPTTTVQEITPETIIPQIPTSTSTSTPPSIIPPSAEIPPVVPSATTTTPVTPPTETPPATPTTTATTTPPTATTTNPNPGVSPQYIYFYSPDQQIIGYLPINPSGNFGAQHLNNRINVWWRNLPETTDVIKIYRAQTTNGPWLKLLEQSRPKITEDSMSLLDNTLKQALFYKMDVFAGPEMIVTFGPVMLEEMQ